MQESNNQKFNHLKIHTQYSICEGAIKIDELKNFCKENKINSVGLSDTSNLCGSLEFSENALKEVAKMAMEKKTGARGLRSILEKLLLDEMYESPSRKDIEQIIIDKENVTDDIQPKMVLKEKKESKDSKQA